jgi:hypothetical protein
MSAPQKLSQTMITACPIRRGFNSNRRGAEVAARRLIDGN